MAVALEAGLRALRDQPFDLLREIERRVRVAMAGGAADHADAEEWVGIAFRMNEERFVVARSEIREVLMVPTVITRIPGAKVWLRGLANVRGHLLPLADLRDFLGAGPGGSGRNARVLVAQGAELQVGLIVDEVFGFRRFLRSELVPEVPEPVIRCQRFLSGCFRRAGDEWLVFSIDSLLADREFQRAAAD